MSNELSENESVIYRIGEGTTDTEDVITLRWLKQQLHLLYAN